MSELDPRSMLAYLNGELDDPHLQHLLDQSAAAADDVRAAFGITSERTAEIPTDRARAVLDAIWTRVLSLSSHAACEHLLARPIQATVCLADERRQMCLDCASVHQLARLRLGQDHQCLGCGAVERLTTEGDPSGALWGDSFQRGRYVALALLLCYPCWSAAHEVELLPKVVRDGLAREWAERDARAAARSGGRAE